LLGVPPSYLTGEHTEIPRSVRPLFVTFPHVFQPDSSLPGYRCFCGRRKAIIKTSTSPLSLFASPPFSPIPHYLFLDLYTAWMKKACGFLSSFSLSPPCVLRRAPQIVNINFKPNVRSQDDDIFFLNAPGSLS